MTKHNENFIMLPKVDYCFKELMEDSIVRKKFIAALLKTSPDTITSTELLPTIMQGNYPNEKTGILDVRVCLADGTQFDLEMQVAYFEYWDKRTMFYWSKMYTSQFKKGEDYDALKKCIHVSILDFVLYPEDDRCYRTIHLHDTQSAALYSDLLELQILELPKLPETVNPKDDLMKWMKFFNAKTKGEFEDMVKDNNYLDEAYQKLLELSADEIKRLEYEAREKALNDYNSNMRGALKRGEQLGIERGIKKGIEKGLKQGLEQGLKEGLEQGLEQGLERGIDQERVSCVNNLMKNMKCTLEQACALLNISLEEYQEAIKCVS